MTTLITHADHTLITNGLAYRGHSEIRLQLASQNLYAEGESLLRYIADYLIESHASVKSSQTMQYGYWLLKFVEESAGILDVWEYNQEATEFKKGADLSLTYWRDQHEVCDRAGFTFTPPRPDQLAVISDGVLEGDAVKGVRYEPLEHMSGWWLVTDRYDGNVESMRREHLYHLTAKRPDLARYIALPAGFRFDLSNGEDVWFDEEALEG
jgi:hypothetical protein